MKINDNLKESFLCSTSVSMHPFPKDQLFHMKNSLCLKSFKQRREKNTINLVGQMITFGTEILFTIVGGILMSRSKFYESKYMLVHLYIMSYSVRSITLFLSSHELRRYYFGTDEIQETVGIKTVIRFCQWFVTKLKSK